METKMPFFREKRGAIEAEPWKPGNPDQEERYGIAPYSLVDGGLGGRLRTPQGLETLIRGDWIVTLPDGRLVIMGTREFKATYEPAEPK